MTVKEWAKEYPEIATSLFKCSVDELDDVLEEEPADTNEACYLTKEDVDMLVNSIQQRRKPMTRLDRVLKLLEEYDALAANHYENNQYLVGYDILLELRKEKQKLTQELIEHGCRRKN
jgi:hypothetical protein